MYSIALVCNVQQETNKNDLKFKNTRSYHKARPCFWVEEMLAE